MIGTNSLWGTSRLVSTFEESATLALAARAKKMASEGRSIINFGAGEPDFVTPAPLIEAAYEALKKGDTKYSPVAGTAAVRKAIAERISEDYGVRFQAEEAMASTGGKQAIFHFLQAVLNPGDEVLILSPYWVSFPEMVKLIGGKPVIVRPSKGERIEASDLEKAITSKTKCFILNSPSNPAGQVYSREELKSFLEVIEPHPIWLLSDDTYYQLVYTKEPWVSALKLKENFRERTCVVGSCSKSYAMTGWRLGWALAPKPIIHGMNKLQSQVTSGPSTASQAAAVAALTRYHSVALEFRDIFNKRRKKMLEGLRKIPGVTAMEPEGAFYVFANFSGVQKDVTRYCETLLEKEGVCVIPGIAFGDANSARLSYACSEANIEEGLKRIEKSL